jgi:Protein of unknown function (DUF1156)/Putative RNA methylase family UPF0020
MIPTSCKRLIEVDFPIAKVSEHSAKEKSIRYGHPSTFHLWWARRPLAACRAVLLGLLLPAPTERECPADFKSKARVLLKKRHSRPLATDQELQDDLLTFIGEFADWDHSANALYLDIGRGLVKAAHPEETPVVVDPFSGGGSIPLEALRLGCEVFASDLNPVACLILKTLLEDIPRYGNAEFNLPGMDGKEVVVHGLADALRHVGKQVKAAGEKELAQFYPPDPDGSLRKEPIMAQAEENQSPRRPQRRDCPRGNHPQRSREADGTGQRCSWCGGIIHTSSTLSSTAFTKPYTCDSCEALGPATLSTVMPCSSMKRRSAASAVESPLALERWTTGLPCFRASSTVFMEPPVRMSPTEKTTVPSLSRTFHSVR